MDDDLDELKDIFYCDGCGELIEENEHGLVVIFVDNITNKPLSGLNCIHMTDSLWG
jgi:hypothetical protein